jgi:hypothetical protein
MRAVTEAELILADSRLRQRYFDTATVGEIGWSDKMLRREVDSIRAEQAKADLKSEFIRILTPWIVWADRHPRLFFAGLSVILALTLTLGILFP